METTNTQVTASATDGSFWHGNRRGTQGWLGEHRGLGVAAIVAAAGTALALNQHWLAAADLVPLLFALPCAVMMFMCMKGGHGQQTDTPPASTQSGTSSITDPRN